MSRPAFFELLEDRAHSSLLCIGLDPRGAPPLEARELCLETITATAAHAACFKPNAAFFEAMGAEGFEVLREIIDAVPEEIPVLLDAKRGDIATSARAYAEAAFSRLGAGAVTVSPYLGKDAIEPFLEFDGTGVFVLCRTSNPGGSELQEMMLGSGEPLYVAVAEAASSWPPDRVGLVAGATVPAAVARIREVAPRHWLLAPGVGAQGGSLQETIAAGLREDGAGILLPVTRSIATAPDPGAAAAELRDAMEAARAQGERPTRAGQGLITALFDAGCIAFGDFELRSGGRSPVYVDLRRLSGHPSLLRLVATRYVPLLGDCDAIAGVPLAGLPIATAVSLAAGTPMVYPRPVKTHGTGAMVEGPFDPGDRVVVVDDVASAGSSILQAADRLRHAGLVVERAAVLVDRGGGADGALAAAGIDLRSVTDLAAVAESLEATERIKADVARRVRAFLGV